MRFRDYQRSAQRSTRQLVVLFVLLIIAMIFVTNAVLSVAWVLSTGSLHFPKLFFVANTGLVLLYVFGSYALEVYLVSDGGASIAIEAGGRELIEPQDIYEKRLCNVVMEVAIATGIRPPRIFLLRQEDAINAFAAGWDVQDSVIAVTRGSIERLTRDELQGVVAHEFSHILHGDMRMNMRLMSMVLGLQLLYNLGHDLVIASGGAYASGKKVHLGIIVGYALQLAGWMGWLCGRILCAAVSRQREFLADASAVKYTRLAEGLAGALRKIAYQQQTERAALHVEKAKKFAPMYLHFESLSKMLATHPPISERLKALGVPYTRFKVADDIQEIRHDEFLSTRLVPESALTPHIQAAPVRWSKDVKYAQNAISGILRDTPLPELDFPKGEKIQQLRAEQSLSGKLSDDRIRSAILAFWVLAGYKNPEQLWQQLCRGQDGKVPHMMLHSVQNLAPDVREPMFERLLAQVESWPLERRQELVASAQKILDTYPQKMPREWLRLAVMIYWLRDKKVRPKVIYNSFEQVGSAVAVLTRLLAKSLNVPDPQVWAKAVFHRLKLKQDICNEVTTDQLCDAVLKMHRSSLMLTPTLLKIWMHEWEVLAANRNRDELQRDSDIFRLMCALLDTPRPPRLIAWHQTPSPAQ